MTTGYHFKIYVYKKNKPVVWNFISIYNRLKPIYLFIRVTLFYHKGTPDQFIRGS